ncbi:hypothetical protein HOP50_15g75710 [Chloropicon primus]|uniref:Thioredoxin domain-containing protein n=1 Tax=Chloropicon primus TaxID=1764295 RepID=A0A5B8MW37_9CHLO|nr:hypothetical protein A3770_15p75460 [Chloropicon primus]UPR04236.1 hypothetical protein HOP50_15g75710 [Chloropicon primus]|eukprot:QDZ25028.1 hypothetical protein A3770_15p75460 [Chloropicon primus]
MRGGTILCALTFWAALSYLTSGALAFSRVMEMTYEDFDEETKVPVYDGPGDFISLAFYSSWDLRSQKFMVEYDKMADMLHEESVTNFTLARVNSANQQNQGITAHYKVKSFPHLFYFHKLEKHPYAKTDAQEMSKVLDSGSLDAAAMLRWLQRITKETFDEEPIGVIHDEI